MFYMRNREVLVIIMVFFNLSLSSFFQSVSNFFLPGYLEVNLTVIYNIHNGHPMVYVICICFLFFFSYYFKLPRKLFSIFALYFLPKNFQSEDKQYNPFDPISQCRRGIKPTQST